MFELSEYHKAGSCEPWSANVVASLAAAVCHNKPDAVVLETGTFMGTTTNTIYGALPGDTFLITVEADSERYSQAQKNLREILNSKQVLCVQCDALEFLKNRESDSLDFVFLDDDHDQQHVALEIVQAIRCLRPGGVICVHDVVGPFELGEVIKVFNGLTLDLPRLHIGGGLGLIQPHGNDSTRG